MPERQWDQTEPNSEERVAYYYSLHPKVEGLAGTMVRVADRNVLKDLKEVVFGVDSEDPVELERRFKFLGQDSIYQVLGEKCKAAEVGQEKSDLFKLVSARARQILIARDPEAILNDPQSFRVM